MEKSLCFWTAFNTITISTRILIFNTAVTKNILKIRRKI